MLLVSFHHSFGMGSIQEKENYFRKKLEIREKLLVQVTTDLPSEAGSISVAKVFCTFLGVIQSYIHQVL